MSLVPRDCAPGLEGWRLRGARWGALGARGPAGVGQSQEQQPRGPRGTRSLGA